MLRFMTSRARRHPRRAAFSRLLLAAGGLLLSAVPLAAAEKPPIVPRAAWHAKPAIPERMERQTPREIVIHHTGVRKKEKLSLEKKLQGLQGFSLGEKRWGDVPYHFYIDAAGRIGEGRDLAFAGDTNTRYDVKDRIQVVIEGDFEKETPSDAQIAAMRAVVAWLRAQHRIEGAKVHGHDDLAQTDCPGKSLKPFLAELRK